MPKSRQSRKEKPDQKEGVMLKSAKQRRESIDRIKKQLEEKKRQRVSKDIAAILTNYKPQSHKAKSRKTKH